MINIDDQTQRRIQTISLAVLAVGATTFMIYWLRPVLVPLVVAIFLVSALGPILTALENSLSVSRVVAAAITFLAGVVILIVFGITLWVSVFDLTRNSEAYVRRVNEIVAQVEGKIPQALLRSGLSGEALTGDQTAGGEAEVLIDGIVRNGITLVTQSLVSLVSTSVVVLIYVFFLLMGTTSKMTLSPTMRDINYQVRSFLALKTVISILTGLAFGIALRIFGVPMAFTFGVLAFLLNFVPNVGPLVASLLPIPLVILDPEGSITWMISVIAVTCSIQLISGNIVEPRMMGNSSDLHPVTILVALMFWGMMWGIVGMFLATPIAAGFKIVLERFDVTKPFANLMAGRSSEEPSPAM